MATSKKTKDEAPEAAATTVAIVAHTYAHAVHQAELLGLPEDGDWEYVDSLQEAQDSTPASVVLAGGWSQLAEGAEIQRHYRSRDFEI